MQVYLSRIDGTTDSAASPDSADHSTANAPTGMPVARVEPRVTLDETFSPLSLIAVGRAVKSMTSRSPAASERLSPTLPTTAPDASSTLMEGFDTSSVAVTSNRG